MTSDSATLPPAPVKRPFVSVVIPAYNESERLGSTLEAIRAYVERQETDWEILVVDDGSSDATASVASQFHSASFRVRILVNEINRGKGASVRRGMLEAQGDCCLLSDADMSTSIEQIERLWPHIHAGADIVIASRDKPESVLAPRQPWHRFVLASAFRNFRQMFLLPDLRDTQCGFKLFRREAAQAVFAKLTTERFAFDLEALVLADRMGFKIVEVGVVWSNNDSSRVRVMRDGSRMLLDMVRIWLRTKDERRTVKDEARA